MGTDIHGFIEFRLKKTSGYWFTAIDIGSLAERYYTLFGYLFGVREPADKFLPVAAGRGLPSSVAEETELLFKWYEGENPTWIGWSELREAIANSHSVHAYRQRAPDQEEPGDRYWIPSSPAYFTESEQERLRQGGVVEKGGYLYRYEADGPLPLGPGWQLIVEFGDRLAQVHGEERVRMVVWFCS
ncbi:MAG: hypothetical protein WCD86_12765 [Ktedonobacteraceae bacterium]